MKRTPFNISKNLCLASLMTAAVIGLIGGCTRGSETNPSKGTTDSTVAPPPPAAPESQATEPVKAVVPAPSAPRAKLDGGSSFDVSWDFNYINFPGKVVAYQVDPDWNYDISQTRVVALGKLPFTRKAEMPFKMSSRGRATLALVIENPTSQPWYFFANFHQIDPTKNGYGIQILCLCINHLFEIPPNSAWYRVVALFGRRIVSDKRVAIRHDVVGMSKDEVRRRRLEANVMAVEKE